MLPTDYRLLEDAINKVHAAIVFFDALMSTIDLKLDTHKGRDARAAVQPLAPIADRTNCAIIGNAHFNKASGSDPVAGLLGSVEFRNVPRAVVMFATDRDGTRVLSRGKNNLGADWPSLEYAIEDAPFKIEGREFRPGRFVLGGESATTAQDILEAEGKGGSGDATVKTKAAIWLIDYMAEHDGQAKAAEGLKAAAEAGYNARAIRRAFDLASVETQRIGFGPGSYVVWARGELAKLRLEAAGEEK